ncbi:helix-turn-helix domain-containing protein [Streptomyces sp. CC210A]|uniref:helix-turn-helix domain-containing protein n=1 Tax=Streptomyces sp. CC210A TaxID=2898184 RepID=UPI001F2C9669|nr:helix-turn-helix transcriptional regulator [Streptomyces sp. CC210A]
MTTGRIELGPTGRQVAANVKRLREARGLTLRGLSALLKQAGRPLSADALNKIENGRPVDTEEEKGRAVRRVDADDLVALAAVLEVSPSALLLPLEDGRGEDISVTPAISAPADRVWDWMDGRGPLRVSWEGQDDDWGDYFRLSRPPVRRRREQLERIRAVMAEIDEGGDGDG